MIELFGYISAGLLAFCGAPQAWHSYKIGNADGLAPVFLWSWLIGEIGTLIYTWVVVGFVGPLMANYILNIIVIAVILKYKYYPRGTYNEH